MKHQESASNPPVAALSAHVITEELAKNRFGDLLEAEPLSFKKMWVKPLRPQAFESLVAPELPETCREGPASHAGVRIPVPSKQLGSLFDALQKVKDPRSRPEESTNLAISWIKERDLSE